MLEVAENLARLIEKDTSKVQERDKKDYWIIKNPKLADLLDRFTTNPVMGVFAGMLVTILIQSSSATTVITVGLVSAGFMTLRQADGGWTCNSSININSKSLLHLKRSFKLILLLSYRS